MNTERQRMDSLAAQMDKQVAQRTKAREHEGIQPILAEMKIGGTPESREALQALMRNALTGQGGTALEPDVSVKIVGITGELERDGCDFVKMAFLFLTILECPPDCRDFVLAICALSGGTADEFKPMPDAQIAELIGYERHVIKRKRETLIAWQKKSTYALVDIVENERDPVTRHYLPTEYRPRVVPVIAQFIRRARSMRTRSADYAQKNVIERGYHEIVGELSSELPIAPLVQRREAKTFNRPRQQEQMTLMHGQRDQLVFGIEKFLRRTADMKINPREAWVEIQKEVEISIYKMTLNTEWRE